MAGRQSDAKGLFLARIRERHLVCGEPISAALLRQLRADPRVAARRLAEQLEREQRRRREEKARLERMLHFERILWRAGITRVAGVDEAGVGPLAGPVVAAAVVFRPGTSIPGVDDSKKLSPKRRRELARRIRAEAAGIGIGTADPDEIDRLNIYQASLLAMHRAVRALPEQPEHVLVDARTIPDLDLPQNAFQKGDGINFSIAAASIIAKVHRDELMDRLDLLYPGYGFARHKGYPTPEHQQALSKLGPSPVHRHSYALVAEAAGRMSPK